MVQNLRECGGRAMLKNSVIKINDIFNVIVFKKQNYCKKSRMTQYLNFNKGRIPPCTCLAQSPSPYRHLALTGLGHSLHVPSPPDPFSAFLCLSLGPGRLIPEGGTNGLLCLLASSWVPPMGSTCRKPEDGCFFPTPSLLIT